MKSQPLYEENTAGKMPGNETKETSKTPDKFDLNLLDGATCPITLTLMTDPVMLLGDGQTYERSAIESWLNQGHKTSPLTGSEISNFRLMPNYAMKSTIDQLRTRFSPKELQKMEAEVQPKLSRKVSSSFPSSTTTTTTTSFSSSPSAPPAPSAPYYQEGNFDVNPSLTSSTNMSSSSSSTMDKYIYDEGKGKDFDTRNEGKEKDFDTRNEEKDNERNFNRYALLLAGGYGSGHVNAMRGGFETYVNDTDAFDIWTVKHQQDIPGPETHAISLSGSQIYTGSGLTSRIWAMERTEDSEEIAKNKNSIKTMKRFLSKYVLSAEELAERQQKEAIRIKEAEEERLRLESQSIAYPFSDPSWKWNKKVELSGHREKITCAAIAQNSTFAISGGLDGRLLFWHPKVYDDNSTWTCKNNMFHGDEESPVRAVEIHGANSLENHIPEWYASGGDDWAVRIWDAVHPDRMLAEYNFSAHTLPISCLSSASYGHDMLASTCLDGKLFLWSPKSRSSQPIAEFKDASGSSDYFSMQAAKAHDGAIRAVAVDASYGGEGPRWIATGGEDGYLKIWDTRMRRLLEILACPSQQGLEYERTQRLPWLFDKGEELSPKKSELKLKNSYYDNSSWEGVEVSNKDFMKLTKSSPDGRFLIRVDGTNEVAIYDTTTWQEVTSFKTDMREIHACTFAILNQIL